MTGKNLLFIMSDEHSRRVLGCYGNDVIQTPTLDRLAADGTLFENAYCNSPICVPSRASFATGRYVHDIGCWDNAIPYRGDPGGWGHRLLGLGHRVDSIGKLHYRASADPNGFDNEILPMHVLNGKGDIQGMLRRPPPRRPSSQQLADDAGEGESTYIRYDRDIRDAACRWLHHIGGIQSETPWVLFVSFVCPHFPLIAPAEFFRRYPLDKIPMPQLRGMGEFPNHPVIKKLRETQNYEDYFRDEDHVRTAMAAYYGMVTYLDDNIGRVLSALEAAGLSENTQVIYTSDHGDNLGARTMWGKSNMYDESAGIPLIMQGAGVPAGRRVSTPVSLLDAYPTIMAAVSVPLSADERMLPGRALLEIAAGADPDRTVLAEYHAVGSITGMFMVRFGAYKYVHHEGYRPQLFNIVSDPLETRDLALEPGQEELLAEGDRRLRAICNPEAVTALAFADQERRIAAFGGEEVVRSMGSYPYTPAPGEEVRMSEA